MKTVDFLKNSELEGEGDDVLEDDDDDDDDDDDEDDDKTLKQTVSEKGRVMRTRARESTVRAQPQT